jgi:hypothetical protein
MADAWRVVSRQELLSRGHSAWEIRKLVQRGLLSTVGHGVFLEGPRLEGDEGWYQQIAIAAARFPRGVITGEAAAALHGLDGFDPGCVPVTIAVGHRSSSHTAPRRRLLLAPQRFGTVAVTAVDETLLGLGAVARPRPGCRAATEVLGAVDLVELAVESALRSRLVTPSSLADVIDVAGTRPGRRALAAVLARRGQHVPTGSYLETRCVQVLRACGLDDFERQVDLHDTEGWIGRVDFHRDGVVIEVVGKKWHEPRVDPDSHRYTRLCAAGYRPLLFTFTDIEHRPEHVIRATRAARAASAGEWPAPGTSGP